jgi:uncharacterized protein (DUF1330 family)
VTTTTHIEPTDLQVAELMAAAQGNDGPVAMLNVLKFREDSGRDSYLRYAQEVQPHLDRVGASIVYVGDAGGVVIGDTDSAWWDSMLVVHYPSRAAFLAMVLDPAYVEIAVHRTKALADSRLIATDPWVAIP